MTQNFSVRSPVGNLMVPHGNRSADLQDLSAMITTWRHCIFWHSFHVFEEWTWVNYISNVLSIKTILFDILDFWCQLVVIRFVKTFLKHRMFVSFMKISACWLLHRLIKFNKICWEKRPANPRPNLRTSFCRRDLKNTQPHLKWQWEICENPRITLKKNQSTNTNKPKKPRLSGRPPKKIELRSATNWYVVKCVSQKRNQSSNKKESYNILVSFISKFMWLHPIGSTLD